MVGIGSVTLFTEAARNGSCQKVMLRNVFYIPDFSDGDEPQIHHLIVARGILTAVASL